MTRFAVIVVVPSTPGATLFDADRKLVFAAARAENSGQQWDDRRKTVGANWGKPPVLIEPVRARIAFPGKQGRFFALNELGQKGSEIHGLNIGETPTLWYEIEY